MEVEDVHVEGDHTFTPMDPVYIDKPIGHLPIAATMSSGHAAICLGIAQAALDAVAELGRSKVNVDPVPKMPDRSFNQYTIAEAAVKIDAMRDHLHKMTGMIWHLCLDGQKPGPVELAKLWSTSVTTARTCQRIVSDLYEIAGATAVYESFSIERERRDIDAMMQHVIVQRFWMEEAGKIIFGLEPSNPLFFL